MESEIYFNGKKVIKVIKKDNKQYVKLDDEKLILRKDINNIKLVCSCCNFKYVKKIQKYHIEKKWLCKSCRVSGENNPMYGKKMSEEQKKKRSDNMKGENNHFYGKKHSDETKKKIGEKNSLIMKGENNPMYNKNVFDILKYKYGEEKANEIWKNKYENHSNNMKGENNHFYGKKHSDETKEKISTNLLKSEKFKNMRTLEYREKMSKALKNRKFSVEHRKKLRLISIEKMNEKLENNFQIIPNYNPKACEIFDEISEKKNIYIEHAMNGGEYHIKELGYWVDGYDRENNIVYEFDEKYHNNLKQQEKDKTREQEIINLLDCKFIRIKE